MRLIDESRKNWSKIGENQNARQVSASIKTDELYASLTVQPTNLVIDIECSEGLNLDKLSTQETVKGLVRSTTDLFREFSVSDIERAGVRVFCGAGEGTFSESKSKIESQLSTNVINTLSTNFGAIEDIGFNIDGHRDELISFKLRFGPYQKEEAGRYFRELTNEIAENAEFNYLFDLDVYEQKFSVSATPVHKWVNEGLEYSTQCLQELLKVVRSS